MGSESSEGSEVWSGAAEAPGEFEGSGVSADDGGLGEKAAAI